MQRQFHSSLSGESTDAVSPHTSAHVRSSKISRERMSKWRFLKNLVTQWQDCSVKDSWKNLCFGKKIARQPENVVTSIEIHNCSCPCTWTTKHMVGRKERKMDSDVEHRKKTGQRPGGTNSYKEASTHRGCTEREAEVDHESSSYFDASQQLK